MIVAVLSLFILALLAPLIVPFGRRASGWVLALLPLALAIWFAFQTGDIADGGVQQQSWDWVPDLGIRLAFYLDGVSLLFALLVCGIGALVLVYAGGYMAGHPSLTRLYVLLLLFMGAMLGLVLADNVLSLFIFWELTSVTSYMLIGLESRRQAARAAALQALLITGGGGLAMLAGLVLLGSAGGSFEFSALLASDVSLAGDPLYLAILLLLLAGIFTKSAQFPFHFWLPAAMEAPTPVSAYLHSATMVKAGVYLAMRVQPILGGTDEWLVLLTLGGGITMLLGGYLSIRQHDLKLILAYSTVSSLGLLIFLIGIGTEYALVAAVTFLLAHALYKGALFLVAGIVDHEAGTRDIRQLGGLRRMMPLVALAAGLAALSMAGLPPLFGFVAKELIYEAATDVTVLPAVLATAAVVATGILLVVQAILVGYRPFLTPVIEAPQHLHAPPLALWLGPVVLALLGVGIGLAPGLAGDRVLEAAASAITGDAVSLKLSLWHGLTLALGLSAVTVLLGLMLYRLRPRVLALTLPAGVGRWAPGAGYAATIRGLTWLAISQTRLLQNGYLRVYLIFTGATVVLLTGAVLVREQVTLAADLSDVRHYEVALVILMMVAAGAAIATRSLLVGVASLGVVGYGLALIYVLFGAPDLAMTQFLIETLTVVLLVLVFYFLPRPAWKISARTRLRDIVVALAMGSMMTVLVLAVHAADRESVVSPYYIEESVPAAHGRNIVNVILVDFRALDTLGEITVLAVAALGVYAVLKLRRTGSSE